MEVAFRTGKLQRCYENLSEASRQWGPVVGNRYIRRIETLQAAAAFGDLMEIKSLRLHALKGDREGEYALTIHDRWRLILISDQPDRLLVQEVTNHYDH